ncbi:histidine N-acetyltransferase-like isoform X3 [Hemiscyllium ocellatum]|uniref:histidine N-acetyltransferase-like isoform X3 n=1 Tax=Hemiscyllium ocellatum TaxID=170820 RepID=UPI0029666461|nr:histidine N-acetyltransferase-like isoform X3 [Hemiscyllium ocellatum]
MLRQTQSYEVSRMAVEGHALEFCLAEEADFEEVMSISGDIYGGLDYLPVRYHAWIRDPARRVILAKKKGQIEILCTRFKVEYILPKLEATIAQLKESGEEWEDPILLGATDVKRVFLSPKVVNGVLPGKTIIQDWAPYKPLESNLEKLVRQDLIWMADDKEEPTVVSLGTAPYRVPLGTGYHRLNIDIFGKHFPRARNQFLAQVQQRISTLEGPVYCILYIEPSLWQDMLSFCQTALGLHVDRELRVQNLLEADM